MFYFLCALGAYLIGSYPTGVFLTRRKYGLDVRDMGSGNIGATNVTRVFGWYAGALTFLVDFMKGMVPLYFIKKYFPDKPWALAVVATFLVIGHCYSFYLGFRGGKGVATSLGCTVLIAPWCALASGISYVAFLVITKISAVGSLAGLLAAFIYILIERPPTHVVVLIMSCSLIVLWRHKENIRRLRETIRTRRKK
jgi:acyl phosphate:glycerol-3-phosphate acyltransferase